MSLDDATGHAPPPSSPEGRPILPTRRAPGRSTPAEDATPLQRTIGEILRESECVIFDTEDERMSDVVNRLVPAETRFGIRIRISVGTYKIPFNGLPPLDIGTTLADILNRWGPGRYLLELVRLGANEATTGQPLKSLSINLSARSDQDVGEEEWPIQWDDKRVPAELRRDRDDRRRIRSSPGWTPPSDEDDGEDAQGYDPQGGDPRGYRDGHDPRGPWSHGGMDGATQPGFGPQGSQVYNPHGMPGGGVPPHGAIATDPNAYPPGTTWVMSPHGLIPQIPAPPPPPPALTAEALAAAFAAAQPKREPSMLEQLLAAAVGSFAVAIQTNPIETIKNVREAIAPPAPPPPAPPAPAPQGPTASEIALQMQKLALENQLALEKMQRDRDLTLEKIQRENEVRLRELEAKQAAQRAADQLAALQNQLNAMRGQETEQSKVLKAQIAELTKQVNTAQRDAAANDDSVMGKIIALASTEGGAKIMGVVDKFAERLFAEPPTQQPMVYPMPTGVPGAPVLQPQWAPQSMHDPMAQHVPMHDPMAQHVPMHDPMAQHVPMHDPMAQHVPMQGTLPHVDTSMPPAPAEMPPFQTPDDTASAEETTPPEEEPPQ